MKWRKWNIILHRDIGYLCVGLTIIYAVSGVAVNHIADWNPNYVVERDSCYIEPKIVSGNITLNDVTSILQELAETGVYKNHFRPDSQNLQIFMEGSSITVNLKTGKVMKESIRNRTIFRELNFLHLNHPKKLWTYFADIYAIALAFLAISGMLVIKGKKGIKGRGKWLIALGILLPVIFLKLYF